MVQIASPASERSVRPTSAAACWSSTWDRSAPAQNAGPSPCSTRTPRIPDRLERLPQCRQVVRVDGVATLRPVDHDERDRPPPLGADHLERRWDVASREGTRGRRRSQHPPIMAVASRRQHTTLTVMLAVVVAAVVGAVAGALRRPHWTHVRVPRLRDVRLVVAGAAVQVLALAGALPAAQRCWRRRSACSRCSRCATDGSPGWASSHSDWRATWWRWRCTGRCRSVPARSSKRARSTPSTWPIRTSDRHAASSAPRIGCPRSATRSRSRRSRR